MKHELVGQTVGGKYQVVQLLGEGGMGAVYEALHTGTGRRVALKMIRASELDSNPQLLGRFEREVRAAAAIETQHIVQVFDTGTEAGAPYMVMELMNGEDLEHALARLGPLAPDVALKLVAQACRGLAKAHQAGIVHRDIKAANLFLCERDEDEIVVKLLDFGIAKVRKDPLAEARGGRLTTTGTLVGSPLYMSPEQALGRDTVDHRSDVWSLGIVLFEALTGHTPHDHVDKIGELIVTICSTKPRSVTELAPWVPPEVAAIVDRALRLEPEERFQSAEQMFEALKSLLPSGYRLHKAEVASAFAAPESSAPSHFAPTLLADSGSLPGVKLSSGGVTAPAITSPSRTPVPVGNKRRAGLAILGALLFAAGGSFIGWKLLTHPPHDVSIGTQPASSPSSPTPSEAPSATVPTPSLAPAMSVAEPSQVVATKVRLRIVPATALVEVDGTKASVKDGVVELAGAVGSEHRVRVVVGHHDTERVVTVTQSGASPESVVLDVVSAKPSGKAAAAAKTEKSPKAPSGKTPEPKPSAQPAFKPSDSFE